jgi:hypothetical protein
MSTGSSLSAMQSPFHAVICRDFITFNFGMSCYSGSLVILNLALFSFPNKKPNFQNHQISEPSGTATEIRSIKWRWPSFCLSPSTMAPCSLVVQPWGIDQNSLLRRKRWWEDDGNMMGKTDWWDLQHQIHQMGGWRLEDYSDGNIIGRL